MVVFAEDEAEGVVLLDVEVSAGLVVRATLLIVGMTFGEVVGGMIEVVRVGIGSDWIEVELEDVGREALDVEIVGTTKEPVVWIVKKGTDEAPLAIEVELDGKG
jgi:hypothetical protein